jgi:hypothetical protein
MLHSERRQSITLIGAAAWPLARALPTLARPQPRLKMSISLSAMLSLLYVLVSYDDAFAQQRITCSRALQACSVKLKICQSRHKACMETGCWTVGRIRRCGYVKE